MYETGVVLALGEQYVRLFVFVVFCIRLNWVVLLVIDAVYELASHSRIHDVQWQLMTGLR